jgi:predicted nucleic acid-binding protein
MASPPSLSSSCVITADTSTIINLNATGCAREILEACGSRFVVVDVVRDELEDGRRSGRRDADLLRGLLADGCLELVQLDADATDHFESLVVGPAVMTLDDGEAATIAYAVTKGTTAVIDERKATNICAQRFPGLAICSTVDILARPEVRKKLGDEGLSSAVFRALVHGRMRVFQQHLEWVVALIGSERAAACTSLPRIARRERTS